MLLTIIYNLSLIDAARKKKSKNLFLIVHQLYMKFNQRTLLSSADPIYLNPIFTNAEYNKNLSKTRHPLECQTIRGRGYQNSVASGSSRAAKF